MGSTFQIYALGRQIQIDVLKLLLASQSSLETELENNRFYTHRKQAE